MSKRMKFVAKMARHYLGQKVLFMVWLSHKNRSWNDDVCGVLKIEKLEDLGISWNNNFS
jgi:hypothetical protein